MDSDRGTLTRNHRGSYIGWPTRDVPPGNPRASSAQLRSPPRRPPAVSSVPLDSVLSQVITEWTRSRKDALSRENELKRQLYEQAQRILALEAELAAARRCNVNLDILSSSTALEPQAAPETRAALVRDDVEENISKVEDAGTALLGSITLLGNTAKINADINILLNSHTMPRWRAKPDQLGKILAETILDKKVERDKDAMRLTISCVMGEEADRVMKNLTQTSKYVQVDESVCVCVCISLDKTAVQSLVDAKLGGYESSNGVRCSAVFASAGTLLLDLIGSHALRSEEWYAGDTFENTVMC